MLTEDEKRFYNRNLARKGNFSLNQTAKKCGVKNFDQFHNSGYKGLYNGETADDIAKRKGLRYREDIIAHYDVGSKIRNTIKELGRYYARRLTNSPKKLETIRKGKEI